MKPRQIAQEIFDEDPIVRQTETSFIFESGKRTLKKKFMDNFFDMNNLIIYNGELAMDYSAKDSDAKRNVRHRVKSYLAELTDQYILDSRPKLHSEEALSNSTVLSSRYSFEDFTLYRSILKADSGSMFVYDMVKNKLTDLDPDFYLKALPKELRMNFVPAPCVFKYDPYNIDPAQIVELHRQEVTQINLYIPPAWRLMGELSQNPRCPKIHAKFLCHLFPDKEARAYVICWLKNMILYRNNSILVLNGFKGIGKNILVEMLCVALVGEENFGKGSPALLDKEFNTVLRNNRLIFLDELKITKKSHTKLKDISNSKQNIEAKGVDANNVTETYNSIVISNNDSHDVYVEHDDRRFGCIPMTNIPLKDAFTSEEIKELIDSFKDPEMVRQLGEFIISYENEVYEDPNYVWKCEKFHGLVFNSLTAWQQYIVESLRDENFKGMLLSDFKEDAEDLGVNHFPTNRSKVENFLMNHRHRGEERVGYLEKVGREWHIYSDFIKPEAIEDEL